MHIGTLFSLVTWIHVTPFEGKKPESVYCSDEHRAENHVHIGWLWVWECFSTRDCIGASSRYILGYVQGICGTERSCWHCCWFHWPSWRSLWEDTARGFLSSGGDWRVKKVFVHPPSSFLSWFLQGCGGQPGVSSPVLPLALLYLYGWTTQISVGWNYLLCPSRGNRCWCFVFHVSISVGINTLQVVKLSVGRSHSSPQTAVVLCRTSVLGWV